MDVVAKTEEITLPATTVRVWPWINETTVAEEETASVTKEEETASVAKEEETASVAKEEETANVAKKKANVAKKKANSAAMASASKKVVSRQHAIPPVSREVNTASKPVI